MSAPVSTAGKQAPDHVLGVFAREQLSDALAATHRAGFGPYTRVFDGRRSSTGSQLARAGLEIAAGTAPAPDDLVIVLDPMLATGGSATAAISTLKAWGAPKVIFVGLIAAPEGVQRLMADHPDVPVHVALLDRQLDENAYIRPGLGDAGDRMFGTEPSHWS